MFVFIITFATTFLFSDLFSAQAELLTNVADNSAIAIFFIPKIHPYLIVS